MTSIIPTFRPHGPLQADMQPVRGSAASRGYGRRWQKARKLFLAEHPLCQCDDADCQRPATEVHHIRAHRGDDGLFWDETNWQGLTKECHSRLTAREGRRVY
jgi:5-methylcytosine-specific restriction enzyme A